MKRYRFIFLFLFSFVVIIGTSCKSKDKVVQSENDVDAARNFIRAALDGKFDEAKAMLLVDSSNVHYLSNAQRVYNTLSAERAYEFRSASIHIHNVSKQNDSTTVVIYSNSLMNDHDTLKVIKKNDQWLIDLKFLYQHDEDTTRSMPVIKDSIQ